MVLGSFLRTYVTVGATLAVGHRVPLRGPAAGEY
jgi:hypothetical protein